MLNSFIRFERKLYQVFGLELGRPLRLKAVMYFFVIAIVEATIYFTPGIGRLINWIPVGILIIIPIGLAWLLADVGTEGRSPVHFFRSFILYQAKKMKASTLYRGREVNKEKDYQFHNYYTYKKPLQQEDDRSHVAAELNEERDKVLDYLARISGREKIASERLYDYIRNESEVVIEMDDENVPATETEDKETSLQKRSMKKSEERLKQKPVAAIGLIVFFTSVLSITLVLGFLHIVTDFDFGKANADTNDAGSSQEVKTGQSELTVVSLEENLIAGLRSASIQKYSVAVEHFDKLDFKKLEKDDRNAVLFTYLMSSNAQKALDYVPEFDKSIVNFFIAKKEINQLKELQTDSKLIAFEVASLDADHEKVIEYQSAPRMEMDERRTRIIADAYLALNQIDEAYDFAERINDAALRSYIQKKAEVRDPENKKREKENGKSVG